MKSLLLLGAVQAEAPLVPKSVSSRWVSGSYLVNLTCPLEEGPDVFEYLEGQGLVIHRRDQLLVCGYGDDSEWMSHMRWE